MPYFSSPFCFTMMKNKQLWPKCDNLEKIFYVYQNSKMCMKFQMNKSKIFVIEKYQQTFCLD